MSRLSTEGNDQASVEKYLLPREDLVAEVRPHRAMLLAPAAEALGVLLVALLISLSLHEGRSVKIAVWLITTAVLLGFLYILINRVVTYYIITSKRILMLSGLMLRRVNMRPLGDVRDLEFTRSFAGRVFGYGTFKSRSGDLILPYVPYPEELYQRLSERIFPDAAGRDQAAPEGTSEAATRAQAEYNAEPEHPTEEFEAAEDSDSSLEADEL